MCVCVCVCVCVSLSVCVCVYVSIGVIYMRYSMKQVRYSGVKDGNTLHNQVSTLRYRVPDHPSQFHRHISNFKVNSHSSLNRLSQFIA